MKKKAVPKKKKRKKAAATKRGAKKASAEKGGGEKASKEVLEKRKRLMKDAELALGAINSYPVLKKKDELEAARGKVLDVYSKGDAVVRQFILFVIHEHLSKAVSMRVMENFDFFKKVMGEKAEPLEVRKNVYRSIFNYSNSLEGTVEFLMLLGDMGDEGAAKVLSKHLSFYMGGEQSGLQMLRNAAVEALECCECTYALDVLIAYANYAEKNERFIYALRGWEEKLNRMAVGEEEKAQYISEINDLMMVKKERDLHYG